MTVGVDHVNEWQQRLVKDIDGQLYLHDPFENAYTRSSLPAYTRGLSLYILVYSGCNNV